MGNNLAIKGIIRRNDGKILIIKRSDSDGYEPGTWETVDGGARIGSTPQEELKREIKEEAGIEVDVREPYNVFTFTKENGETKNGITFICDYKSGEVNLSKEHSDFAWINPFDFKKYKSIPALYFEIAGYANKFSGEHERFVVSQKAILIRNGKYLIAEIDKRPGIWDLSGGRIDNKENSETSFKREMKEELNLENFKLISGVDYGAWHTNHGFAVCGIANLIETEEEINLSDEHTKCKWIGEDEIDSHNFVWPVMNRMIKNGFKFWKIFIKK